MMKIAKILVPTDLSPSSFAAVGYAACLASRCGADLLVLHIVPPGSMKQYFAEPLPTEPLVAPGASAPQRPRGSVEDLLEQKKQIVRNFIEQQSGNRQIKNANTRAMVRFGDIVTEILAAAREDQCDLIVMTTAAGALRHFFHRSTLDRVLRKAPCPVLSIHPWAQVRTESDERVPVTEIHRWAA